MPKRTSKTNNSYLEKLEKEVESNQSKVSLVLGALIILVIGILVFNYFNKNKASLGPAQQIESTQPDKYTVKENDTLFNIADKYYQDGYKYTEIAKTNNLTNPDQIEAGQVLEIPKLEAAQPTVSPSLGTGGSNETTWGPKIDGNTYTVEEGDWLSTIAGRAYGDIFAYERIAKANNIPNPDLIEPGTTLTIPR